MTNKEILQKANEAVANGDNEGFLQYCTEDVEWTFVGDRTLRGKDAVRAYMQETYVEPPEFDVRDLVAEGDVVVAVGKISLKGKSGEVTAYQYCDAWRFYNGKMAELRAFVIRCH